MNPWKRLVLWLPFAAVGACLDVGDPYLTSDELAVPTGPLSYDEHIKPILLEAGCLGCHFAGGGGSGGLDASSPEGLQRGGESGRAAVVPCEHKGSYMWERVRWCEMPFPGYPNCLDTLDVAIIARWIDQGGQATYEAGLCPDAPLE